MKRDRVGISSTKRNLSVQSSLENGIIEETDQDKIRKRENI